MAISKQQKAFYRTFSQHGSGNSLVKINPQEVVLLAHISYIDIFEKSASWFLSEFERLAKVNFYKIS